MNDYYNQNIGLLLLFKNTNLGWLQLPSRQRVSFFSCLGSTKENKQKHLSLFFLLNKPINIWTSLADLRQMFQLRRAGKCRESKREKQKGRERREESGCCRKQTQKDQSRKAKALHTMQQGDCWSAVNVQSSPHSPAALGLDMSWDFYGYGLEKMTTFAQDGNRRPALPTKNPQDLSHPYPWK